ncbi:MAG TPA: outer membrane protein assembly factor BamE [Rhodanobacter sp.]|nr:outer membrane protein assembly factor BamE [Rhodanobacter sp.]
MHKLITLPVAAMLAFSIAGCHIAYTPDVQQGNLLDKKMVDQLKPGMTKHQVLVLLGTPSVRTPFDNSRWDYVSTQSRRGSKPNVRTFQLTFNNDTLVRTEGDFFARDPQQLIRESRKYNSGYPATETEGDKSKSPDDKKTDGGFGKGQSTDDGH